MPEVEFSSGSSEACLERLQPYTKSWHHGSDQITEGPARAHTYDQCCRACSITRSRGNRGCRGLNDTRQSITICIHVLPPNRDCISWNRGNIVKTVSVSMHYFVTRLQ